MAKKGNINNKNKKWFLIALLAFLLFSFKKKPTGYYEPEDGEFGEFGTDGDFEEMADDALDQSAKGVSAKSMIGGIASAMPFDDSRLVDDVIDNSNDCGCE